MRPMLMLLVTFHCSTLQAGGLIEQLPEDGSFVEYSVDMNVKGQEEFEYQIRGTLILRSVGTEVIEGETCRWLEYDLTLISEEQARKLIVKMLFPETAIKDHADPAGSFRKIWVQQRDEKPKSYEKINTSQIHPIPAFLFQPLADQEKLDPIPVETPLGKLTCPGIKGTGKFEGGREVAKYTQTSRLSNEVPFGVAASSFDIQVSSGNGETVVITMALKLKKAGKAAKSALPEHGLTGPMPEPDENDAEELP